MPTSQLVARVGQRVRRRHGDLRHARLRRPAAVRLQAGGDNVQRQRLRSQPPVHARPPDPGHTRAGARPGRAGGHRRNLAARPPDRRPAGRGGWAWPGGRARAGRLLGRCLGCCTPPIPGPRRQAWARCRQFVSTCRPWAPSRWAPGCWSASRAGSSF